MTDSLEIGDLYDITSGSYDALYREEQYEKYRLVEKEILKKRLTSIVDIGCGTGLLVEYLNLKSYHFNRYVCLDLSKEMIRAGSRKFSDDPRIAFIQADAEMTPFMDSVFDGAFMITVWNNIVNKDRALSEIKRITRDQGLIVVTVLRKTNDLRPIDIDNGFRLIAIGKDEIYINQ